MSKFIFRKLYSLLFLKHKQCLNPIATIYFNFQMLPFKKAIKFPVLIYGKCAIVSASGKLIIEGDVKKGMLKIGLSDPVRSWESTTVLNILGKIRLKNICTIRRGFHLQINNGGALTLGNNVFLGDNGTMICSKSISIGDNSRIGNNIVMMDTDFHYIASIANREIHACSKPIEIRQNCWIAGYNVVKKGVILPEGTIVAGPYSMVGKDYTQMISPYSIIGGSPAKIITSGYRRVYNYENQLLLHEYFKNHEENFKLPPEKDLDSFCLPK